MKLLEEIEHGAASEETSLGTLLRKCLILASRLDSRVAEDWVEWELNGYPSEKKVPDYRVLAVTIKANMADIARTVTDWTVPPALLGEAASKFTRYECRQGVGGLEHLLRSGDPTLALVMGNLPLILNRRKALNMDVISAWGEVDSSQMQQILESVRNRILKFALALSKEYPNAGAVGATRPNVTEKANQIFINNIYGHANIVGNANSSDIILNVVTGNIASLRQALQSSGVSGTDIGQLEEALHDEPEAVDGGFGPKVSAWLNKMLQKTSDGTWLIGTSAAGDILSRILSKFYGLE